MSSLAFTSTGQVLIQGALVGLALVIAVRSYRQRQARRRFEHEHGCQPLRSWVKQKIPWVGIESLLVQIKVAKEGKILETGQGRFEEYGTTFGVRVLMKDFIMTIDPQNLKAVLATQFKDFGLGAGRQRAMRPLLGHGIFVSDGERWHKSRSLVRPNFVREQIADLEAFERLFETLLRLIPRDGRTIDLQDLFFAFTIDSATEFLFGQSVHALDSRLQGSGDSNAAFATHFNYAQEDAVMRFRLHALVRFHHDKRANEAIEFCHAYVQKFVDEALRSRRNVGNEEEKAKRAEEGGISGEKYVFLQQLAMQTDDPVVLRDELLNILLAGRDTTASLLGNLFFVLARRPDLWAKLKTEISELGGVPPTYETLRNLKYLKYCLNECLRLYPVVPVNSRTAQVDTVLPRGGGPDGLSPIFVKKGTSIGYNVYAMHRRKDVYGEDAEEFVPERWETLRPDWSYLPFNAGPRICVGQQYALTEAAYVTTRLLQEFQRIENRDPEDWKEFLTLTVCSRNGVKVGLYA